MSDPTKEKKSDENPNFEEVLRTYSLDKVSLKCRVENRRDG